ncbi:GNAT family N-acetyltransferase [Candidatus Bathyarchaeota archaeon]|jgi:[ribosomal protein S5]-alanine N-acetyltransferase|nr:GNAT family N-acetyltransferase [Candidatus Bathyarchaeota archaeon]MBT4319834.1 GNAT family N-acetyltransferase [Candidatus Bathyarchaeota archaeon]MBT4425207.1 GNAT family N-acetyltransferase [Candidatus Bathyarchaeota archaeon]MBT6604371.1 GNAT family N-acetyltransferase [Candidatus Bathyarchaeota archaeon]MBT7185903.1 GNAT family N-acetyltransferase [Candidatus Bathyarchaeota archaeon]
MVTIETKRLTIREFTHDDVDGVHRYASNPNVVRFMVWGPNTEEETRSFIQQKIQSQILKARESYDLAITLDGVLIGGGGLTLQGLKSGNAELGYCLNETYWGRGIGTEFAAAMIRYGFEDLDLHRVTAKCDPENHGSYRIMEKNGMTREGHIRQNQRIKGEFRDTLVYGILRSEWELSG